MHVHAALRYLLDRDQCSARECRPPPCRGDRLRAQPRERVDRVLQHLRGQPDHEHLEANAQQTGGEQGHRRAAALGEVGKYKPRSEEGRRPNKGTTYNNGLATSALPTMACALGGPPSVRDEPDHATNHYQGNETGDDPAAARCDRSAGNPSLRGPTRTAARSLAYLCSA